MLKIVSLVLTEVTLYSLMLSGIYLFLCFFFYISFDSAVNVQHTTSLPEYFGIKMCLCCVLILIFAQSYEKSKQHISSIYVFSGCQVFSEWRCLPKFTITAWFVCSFHDTYIFALPNCSLKKKKEQQYNENILMSQITASPLLLFFSETTCGPAAALNNH